MKRGAFLGTLAAGGIGTVLAQDQPAPASNQASSGASSPKPSLVETPAVVMAPRADGLEVVWAVSRLSLGRVEWETEDGARGVAAADPFGFVPQGERVVRVRLDGLKPGTVGRVRAHTVAAAGGETVIPLVTRNGPTGPNHIDAARFGLGLIEHSRPDDEVCYEVRD
jgi:glucose/arabinose dehydrogenase